jgi:hypothetical protein
MLDDEREQLIKNAGDTAITPSIWKIMSNKAFQHMVVLNFSACSCLADANASS